VAVFESSDNFATMDISTEQQREWLKKLNEVDLATINDALCDSISYMGNLGYDITRPQVISANRELLDDVKSEVHRRQI
jgi:uncharacterized protein